MKTIYIIACFLANPFVFEHSYPNSLENTHWISQYYHYCNHYHFESDTSGYCETGMPAWALLIEVDTTNLEHGENQVYYEEKKYFRYQISNDTMTLHYTNNGYQDNPIIDVFKYETENKSWVSIYSNSYGTEYLYQGNKRFSFRN